jgi:hypothetical protein
VAAATATGNGRVRGASRHDPRGENYKWIALSNCTLGVLLATLDASITLTAMPDIFDSDQARSAGWGRCSAACGSTTSGS